MTRKVDGSVRFAFLAVVLLCRARSVRGARFSVARKKVERVWVVSINQGASDYVSGFREKNPT